MLFTVRVAGGRGPITDRYWFHLFGEQASCPTHVNSGGGKLVRENSRRLKADGIWLRKSVSGETTTTSKSKIVFGYDEDMIRILARRVYWCDEREEWYIHGYEICVYSCLCAGKEDDRGRRTQDNVRLGYAEEGRYGGGIGEQMREIVIHMLIWRRCHCNLRSPASVWPHKAPAWRAYRSDPECDAQWLLYYDVEMLYPRSRRVQSRGWEGGKEGVGYTELWFSRIVELSAPTLASSRLSFACYQDSSLYFIVVSHIVVCLSPFFNKLFRIAKPRRGDSSRYSIPSGYLWWCYETVERMFRSEINLLEIYAVKFLHCYTSLICFQTYNLHYKRFVSIHLHISDTK